MQRYVAFLRAINVGGHTVKMDRLRALFEDLGLADVESFIASGNVIFRCPEPDPAALEARIEEHLERTLGYAVETFLRTPGELAAIAGDRAPGEEADGAGHTVMVAFLKEALAPEAWERIASLRSATDDFHRSGRELYWLTRGRMSDSPAAIPLGKVIGRVSTMRNMNTVRKLAALTRRA